MIFKTPFWDVNQSIISIAHPPGPFSTSDTFNRNSGDNNTQNGIDSSSLDQDQYRSARGAFFTFWNVTKAVGKPCLIGVIAGEAAVQLANETDDYIVAEAKKSLTSVIPEAQNGELVESIVTRWQVDPFSRGSYSYIGLEATAADYDLLARPIGESVFFAGEATERNYPATVHGAYLSGIRAANEILTSMIGEIKIPLPLVPSKSYQLNKRMQQSVGDSGVPGVPSSVVQAVASGIGTPANMHGIGSGSGSASASHHVTPASSLVHTPTGMVDVYGGLSHHNNESIMYSNASHNHHVPSHLNHVSSTLPSPPHASSFKYKPGQEESATESRLRALREERHQADNERMRADMIKELGERPMKPERSGANPFLIFQKDFWEKCRQQCDAEKQKATGDSQARAARNDVRAALGKMWREFPENEKEPYLIKTKDIKEINHKKNEEYKEKARRYETEADEFKKRWKEQNAAKPSEEEAKLIKFLQEEKLHEKKQMKQQQHHHQMSNNTNNSSLEKYKSHGGGSYTGGVHVSSHLRSSINSNSSSNNTNSKNNNNNSNTNSGNLSDSNVASNSLAASNPLGSKTASTGNSTGSLSPGSQASKTL